MTLTRTLLMSAMLLAGSPLLANTTSAAINTHALKAEHTAATVGMACPSTDFNAFLKAFSDNSDVQAAFTHLPEPHATDVKYPVMPLAPERKTENMQIKVDKLTDTNATVVLDKPETDFKIIFYFTKDKCWTLTNIEDMSG